MQDVFTSGRQGKDAFLVIERVIAVRIDRRFGKILDLTDKLSVTDNIERIKHAVLPDFRLSCGFEFKRAAVRDKLKPNAGGAQNFGFIILIRLRVIPFVF